MEVSKMVDDEPCEKGEMLQKAFEEDFDAIGKVLEGKPSWYVGVLIDAISQSCNHDWTKKVLDSMARKGDGREIA